MSTNLPQNESYQSVGGQLTGYQGYRKSKKPAPTIAYNNITPSGGMFTPSPTPTPGSPEEYQSNQAKLFTQGALVTPTETQYQAPTIQRGPIPLPANYGVFAEPQNITSDGLKLSWGTPTSPVIKNIPGDAPGQYIEDTSNPDLLVKTKRGENKIADFAIRAGRPGSMYTIDHIVPLSLGGADTLENRQILTFSQNEQKTKAQAIPYTLYAYGELSLSEARIMATQWKDRDLTDVPLPNEFGLVSDSGRRTGIEIARETAENWKGPKPVTFKDIMEGIPQATKDLGKGFLPDPVREFIKGFGSGGTLGFLPYEREEDLDVISKASGITGLVLGTLAPWTLVAKALTGSVAAVRGIGAFINSRRAVATTAAAAEGFGISEKAAMAVKAAADAAKETTPWIKNPNLLQRFTKPLTEGGRSTLYDKNLIEASKLAAQKPITLPTLNKEAGYIARILKDPSRRKQVGKFAVQMGVFGQAQQFVANHVNPYILSGLADQQTQDGMIKNIFKDMAFGAVVGIASPTLKGTAYTVMVPTMLSLMENPDEPVDAITMGVLFGVMHGSATYKRPGYNDVVSFGGRPYENPVTAAQAHIVDHASYASLRLYNPHLREVKVGEQIPKMSASQIQRAVNTAIKKVFDYFKSQKTLTSEDSSTILREFKGFSKNINKTLDAMPGAGEKPSLFKTFTTPRKTRLEEKARLKEQTSKLLKEFGPNYKNEIPKKLQIDKITIPEEGMDLQTALTEIKRITIAGRQLYKGTLSKELRSKADLDDLLSYGNMLKSRNVTNMENRFSSLIRFAGNSNEIVANPPAVRQAVDVLLNHPTLMPEFMTKSLRDVKVSESDLIKFEKLDLPEGDVANTGLALEGINMERAKYVFEQKALGHLSPNPILIKKSDLAPILEMGNITLTPKQIKEGEYAIDKSPENAIQNWAVIQNPAKKGPNGEQITELVELGFVPSDHRLNLSTHPNHRAFNQHPLVVLYEQTGGIEGMRPLTRKNHKDTIGGMMTKLNIPVLIGTWNPKSTLATLETGNPFALFGITKTNWKKSVELAEILRKEPNPNPASTDLAKVINSSTAQEKAINLQKFKDNPTRTKRASDYIPVQKTPEREGVDNRQDIPRESARTVLQTLENSLDVAGPAEVKVAFQKNFNIKLDDVQAADIFAKRNDLTMREGIELLATEAGNKNSDLQTALAVDTAKTYLQSGALSRSPTGDAALDIPLLGHQSTRRGTEEHLVPPRTEELGEMTPEQPTVPKIPEVPEAVTKPATTEGIKEVIRNQLIGDNQTTNTQPEVIPAFNKKPPANPEILKEFIRTTPGGRALLTKLAKELSNNGTDPEGWSKFKTAIEKKLQTTINGPKEVRLMRRQFERLVASERRLELAVDESGKAELIPGSLENVGEADIMVREYNKANGLPDDAMQIISINKKRVFKESERHDPLLRFEANNKILDNYRGDSYIPMGITAKGENHVTYVKFEPKLVEKFDENPQKYLNEGEKLESSENKFVRVFNTDILKLPKETTDVDIVKRANLLYNRYDRYPTSEGDSQVIIHNLISKKIGDDTSTQHIKPDDFVNPENPSVKLAIDSFLEMPANDGKMIIGEKLFDKLIDAFAYDPNVYKTGFKPLINADVTANGKIVRMIQKGHAIRADSAGREMLKSEYGLDLGTNEIASFNTNVKIGPKEGTYKINLSDIYLKSLSAGINEGNLKPSLEAKLSVKDPGAKEDLMKLTEEKLNVFEEFNKEIYASTSETEFRAVVNKFADKYGLDENTLFYGTLGESFNLGAAKIGLSHTLEGLSGNLFFDTVLSGVMPNSRRASITPSIKLKIDGPDQPARYPKNDEVVLGDEIMRKINAKEGDLVILLRDPAYDISNIIFAKVVNGSKLGHESLRSEHASVNYFNERMKLKADQDGDQVLIMKVGEGGIPESFAKAIEARGTKILPSTEVISSPTKPATTEGIKEVIRNQLIGDNQTTKISKAIRMMNMLVENGVDIKIYGSGGGRKSKYEILFGDKIIEAGETSASIYPDTYRPRFRAEERQLASQALQEALDSKKSTDIIKRTKGDSLWMLKQVFSTESGRPMDNFQARALNGALKNYSQAFDMEFFRSNSKKPNNVFDEVFKQVKETFTLFKSLKDTGVELTPLQEKMLRLSNVTTFKITSEQKVAADKAGVLAVREKYLKEVDIKNPDLVKLRNFTEEVKTKYNDPNEKYTAKERTELFKSIEDYFFKRKDNYSPETIRDMSIWAAGGKEANIAHGERYPTTKYIRRLNSIINATPEIARTYNEAAEASVTIKDIKNKMAEAEKRLVETEETTTEGTVPQTAREIENIISSQYPIGKKIMFFENNGVIDEGRINTYTTDSTGHTNGFEVEGKIVPFEKLVNPSNSTFHHPYGKTESPPRQDVGKKTEVAVVKTVKNDPIITIIDEIEGPSKMRLSEAKKLLEEMNTSKYDPSEDGAENAMMYAAEYRALSEAIAKAEGNKQDVVKNQTLPDNYKMPF